MYVLAATVLAASTEAVPTELTLHDAYRRAREAAGAIRAGAARVDEARGRLDAARAPRDNPSLEGFFGRRRTAVNAPDALSRTDLELGARADLRARRQARRSDSRRGGRSSTGSSRCRST